MSDKKGFMGLAALAAAGAGAAMLMKKTKEINEEETFHVKKTTENYRNTERGKYDEKQQGYLLYQRQLRSICPPGEAGRRG